MKAFRASGSNSNSKQLFLFLFLLARTHTDIWEQGAEENIWT
jgi:hypothetical protein